MASSGTMHGFCAQGVGYYKIFWIFLTTSFLGAVAETGFMLLTRGELQNRSGVLYGWFSLVWGMGAVLFTVCFHRLAGTRDLWVFLAGTFLGGGYEYLCSWVQEVFFGACFWDYSHIPLNVNGRVSLLYSMFWGMAAVVWVKELYPRFCSLIGRLSNDWGRAVAWVLTGLMIFNILISAAALSRWNQRQLGLPAESMVERFLDRHYPDERMYKTYSTLTFIGTDEAKREAGVGTADVRESTAG